MGKEMTQERAVFRGDVFFIDPARLRPSVPGVAHPHVVIQDDVLNRSRIPTTVVCGISSNPKRLTEPGNVALREGEGDLRAPSVVIVSQVCSVDKADLGEKIGTLDPTRVDEILRGLAFLERSFF
jgi:mRNA interferase MazF